MASICASSLRGRMSTAPAGGKLDTSRAVPIESPHFTGRRACFSCTTPSKSLSSVGNRTVGLNIRKTFKVDAQYESGGVPASGLSGLPNFGVSVDSNNFGGQPGPSGSGVQQVRSPTRLAAAAMSAPKSESKTAKLFLDMEATKLELMEQELKAARSKNYRVAERLTAAIKQVDEVMATYRQLMHEEVKAVKERDYTAAASVKRSMTRVLKSYGNVRGRNFWMEQSDQVDEDGELVIEAEMATHVSVRFHITHKVEFGARMAIVGSLPELGNWVAENGKLMQWTKEDTWVCHVDIPLGSTFQYKFVILNENDGGQYWQDGENRECEIPVDPAHKVDIAGAWTRDPQVEVVWFCLPIKAIPGTGGGDDN
uniref:CBM20 domain-containing protein n=1 Tax=Pyramimonas obovata TaxID=1411642 RepID=A0A7S0R959_9CHLO|mmetsp:Transcript_28722/g.62922  ORF Transcript_28722/g.62922 Transcript_28722/m.62922 type:complete len:368 (+) Transcript_28722:153-1256(+)|eukprot:CAMPEP_0118957462 /NCGR_PEP_ID=MMETSP1169-20130426/62117_1 /TAXON_ID=36882 /ORGANISM="Pyramimonas obovata, Strain CCMP722" /LENGTH=367 /DNA_ID=CAMNT_0006905545 /DNA_START=153 /DNA_END=1256 /DNA_ORIENTATION=-